MDNNILININKSYIKKLVLNFTKAILIALTVTMVSVLIFALFLKFLDLSNTAILSINQIIKVSSILVGCIYFSKKCKIKWWYGLLIGFLYAIFAFLVFGLISKSFVFDMSFLYNVIFSSIIGLICAFITKGIKQ